MKTPDKYTFIGALRPFSFPVALVTCSIGLLLAWQQGQFNSLQAVLVLVGGVLLQAGVNLINDYSDLPLLRRKPGSEWQEQAVQRHFRLGMVCFLLASAIALYFVSLRGLSFLLLCVLGLAGALGYTLKPVNYKSRGLGVVLVFWLMGVLMISGSAVALGASVTAELVLQSLPVSLLVSLLLLSNELRDYETDQRDGHNTLTVRVGYHFSVRLYCVLLALAYLLLALLLALGLLPGAFWLLPSLLLTLKPVCLLNAPAERRAPLTPATARLLLGFGLLFCVALINPLPPLF
jgi:1,4-dihydroxy-2-naphthoate octaprenyltransferase